MKLTLHGYWVETGVVVEISWMNCHNRDLFLGQDVMTSLSSQNKSPITHQVLTLFYCYEAVSWEKLYCGSLCFFYNSKNLIVLGRCLKDLFTHFHDFWSQIGALILVTPKQKVERKSEWFCGVKFFRCNFKVEWENGASTKFCFLACGFLFTCVNFTFSVFSIFLIGFFLNGFPNPFIIHFSPNFLFEPNFACSIVVFCSLCSYFGNGFPYSLIVHSRSNFCLVENSLNKT